ncbi:hypothetical protein [Nocardia jinanensis]|nr:hypothetical protein [Nocardia jinanensis]
MSTTLATQAASIRLIVPWETRNPMNTKLIPSAPSASTTSGQVAELLRPLDAREVAAQMVSRVAETRAAWQINHLRAET